MQKIDKTTVLSEKYKNWVDKLDAAGKEHPENYFFYDDVVMNLYKCQLGVCAYTEIHLCPSDLYAEENWENGKYKRLEKEKRQGHFGEMDHYDPMEKKLKYWNWDNLFMIHAKINDLKSNKQVSSFLKPDLLSYSPDKYFDYDPQTNCYYPNTDIVDIEKEGEIQYMIDEVLYLNHPEIQHQRNNYIELLRFKIEEGIAVVIDQFFTAVKQTLGDALSKG